MGPLDGITVLELGGFIAGPYAGQLMGDYGARVIKIEPPAGDPIRNWGVMRDDIGLWWPSLGRNKESVRLDLRDPADRAVAAQLCSQVDIVLENFAPGRMAQWGLDYATIAKENPRLIMVHVSGYGQDGPRATDRGFGSIAEAMGGLRNLTGFPDRPPVRTGVSLGDATAGLFAVVGALAALRERDVSGVGQEVDVALYESVFALTESLLADFQLGGVERSRAGSALPGVAPSNVYGTEDGHELLIAANGDSLFQRLCTAMARPDLLDDPKYQTHQARGANAAVLDSIIEEWTSALPVAQLEKLLDEHGIPRGRIYTPQDILDDEQYAAREMVVRMPVDGLADPVPMPGVVPKFSRTPGAIRHVGARLGEHNDAVIDELGLAPQAG
ncbi:formyl-CoA transferase [Jatrophihabitans sp. GAS493]|uniref:CaiB/BaiF CoA transferase family protein n=1 Tax=Jatrophihabitans sp. GAS493 TaxID=1907575 RepID=UPI000BB89FAA|nr:CoA transferase [Jatrophihabitans sp. GAS493]SOD71806.1 formyl-CoA transferase [Jatrophihabitans sp. GAS493]